MTKLGNSLGAERDGNYVTLYKNGILLKRVNISKAFDRRFLIVELVNDFGACAGKVADALKISRQTVYNTLDTYQEYGIEGLFDSKKSTTGNKARMHEQRRKQEHETVIDTQTVLQFMDEEPENYNQTHDWQKSRYAGGLIFSAILEKDWNFMSFFAGTYGKFVNVFIIFAQMLIHGINSIEQLKTVKSRELGLVCGMDKTPSRTTFSLWVHAVAKKAHALVLIKQFFLNQIKAGLVSCYLLYVDGHFIPYSGKECIHKGYYTQRRLAMPGQTTIVFHDSNGRIVYFQIEEGNGDLRQAIEDISAEIQHHFSESISPLIVSDRASWGIEHFQRMSQYRFLTWEKNINEDEINTISDDWFSQTITVNKHRYCFYEFAEKQTYWNSDKTVSVDLRRIVIWNLNSNKRSVCVSNDSIEDSVFLGQAMLGRWGKSENGFKYIADRFNPHYIPLLQVTKKSEKQEIANPIYKELEKQKAKLKNKLQKNAHKLADVKEVYNQDGRVRLNSKRQRLVRERAELENEIETIANKLQTTPTRTTLEQATNGQKSFKVIDQEAKNIYDLVQAMVWNARRTLIDLLKKHYQDERDVVNLFDHISRCHGWIKSTKFAVHVRLEAMDLPRYRLAQKEFCNTLNNLKPRLLNGKLLIFSVGKAPLS